jgi:hypothetical protein
MFKNVGLKKEVCSFTFVDKNNIIINTIRRRLLSKTHLLFSMKLEKFNGNTPNINFPVLELYLEYVYVNNEIVKENDNFMLNIINEDEFILPIKSNKIIFEKYRGKKIIRKDLYLFSLRKGQNVELKGVIKPRLCTISGFCSFNENVKKEFIVRFGCLERLSPKSIILRVIDSIIESLKLLEKKIKKVEIVGNTFIIEDSILLDETIILLLTQTLTVDYPNVYAGTCKDVTMKTFHKMTCSSTDRNLIIGCINGLIKKFLLIKNDAREKFKQFDKIIDNY